MGRPLQGAHSHSLLPLLCFENLKWRILARTDNEVTKHRAAETQAAAAHIKKSKHHSHIMKYCEMKISCSHDTVIGKQQLCCSVIGKCRYPHIMVYCDWKAAVA